MKVILFVLAAATVASASSRTLFHKTHHDSGGLSFQDCTSRVQQVKITTTGEIVEGPACIGTRVNALRYFNVIKRNVSEVKGADLWGTISTPPSRIQVQDTNAAPRTTQQTQQAAMLGFTPTNAEPTEDVETQFTNILEAINTMDDLIAANQKQIRDAITNGDQEIVTIRAIVLSSDAVLQGGALNLIHHAQTVVNNLPDIQWPDAEDTLAKVNQIIQQLNDLQQMPGWQEWNGVTNNRNRYNAATQRAGAQKSAAEGLAGQRTTESYKTLYRQMVVIGQWKEFINALQEDMFKTAEDVPCGALFNVTQNNTLQLAQTDRLPTLDLKDPTVSTIDNWVIVRCSNPFSVSAGIIFSFVADNEVGIVASKGPPDMAGNPTTVNKFQRTATSDVPKLPIALAHVRLLETSNRKIAFHGSFGVAAHSRSSSQGGSDPEYLLGGSLSLLRTMFITGGPYWATRVNLGGGFSEGDIVPSSVSAPPLQKQGVRGWALAISFTKP